MQKRARHRSDPLALQRIQEEICEAYPNLHFFPEPPCIYIRGSYPVVFEGQVLDRYLIEVEMPADYPKTVPLVREIGGRIPHNADDHVNRADGTCCFFVPDERFWLWPPGSSFLEFLDGPVRSFFLGWSLRKMGQPWPFGERKHGADGIIQFYQNLLNTNDRNLVIRYLQCLSVDKLKGHMPCPCGNGKNIRNCHLDQLKDLRQKVPGKVAKRSLQIVGGF